MHPHLDQPAPSDRAGAYFAPGGELSRATNYEHRPQQERMARAVAAALERGDQLFVEAGTGVGKSLGYLIPAILHALDAGKKLVVSTHTINLQSQLVHKDLPLAKKILGGEWSFAQLMGRQNYLCNNRLAMELPSRAGLLDDPKTRQIQHIHDWADSTRHGLLSELAGSVDKEWMEKISSEGHFCTSHRCAPADCFHARARLAAQKASVVVLNHTLFFTLLSDMDLAAQEPGFLYGNDFVVLDEAHTLESIASRQAGYELSFFDLTRPLAKISASKWLSRKEPTTGRRLLEECGHIIKSAQPFFSAVDKAVGFQDKAEVRLREPLDIHDDSLPIKIRNFYSSIRSYIAEHNDQSPACMELSSLALEADATGLKIADFLQTARDGFVYWLQRSKAQKDDFSRVSLCCAPLDVAGYLRPRLFRPGQPAVFTSATLSVGEWPYIPARLGAADIPVLTLDSPFDFEKQMRVYIVRDMPDPKSAAEFDKACCKEIERFLEMSGGKAFVLFTSYNSMRSAAAALTPFFHRHKIQLMVQGDKLSRDQMLEQFKENIGSVIFGTDSFWTGVDVPGEALSNVIITKLPFSHPDQPLLQAKYEAVEQEGGRSFDQISIPEAVLKFRQGIGRLIRNHSDTGIVAILDSRILTKPYGRKFLSSIPRCTIEKVPRVL